MMSDDKIKDIALEMARAYQVWQHRGENPEELINDNIFGDYRGNYEDKIEVMKYILREGKKC